MWIGCEGLIAEAQTAFAAFRPGEVSDVWSMARQGAETEVVLKVRSTAQMFTVKVSDHRPFVPGIAPK